MKLKNLLAAAVAATLIPTVLRAQPNPAIEQLEHSQRQMQGQSPRMLDLSTNVLAPEIYTGENSDIGPQRILKAGPGRKTWFEVVVDSQYYYSDNVFLSDQHKVGGTLFVNTIQAAFAPEAYQLGSGKFAPAIGYRSQWFNYGLGGDHIESISVPTTNGTKTVKSGLNRLDFNAQTAFLNMRYSWDKWQLYGGFDFTRLLSQPNYDEVYREFVPSLGVQRVFPVCDKMVLSAGAQASYHFTDVPAFILPTPSTPILGGENVNDRFDISLVLSATWQPVQGLVVQPFYRFQYSHYPHFSDGSTFRMERDDTVNTIGGTVTYYFTKNISARVFANYELRDTDYSKSFEYTKLDTGAGLSFDIRF